MPVRIRLRRVGAKKQPSYRLVVADSRAPRNGAFIETIGYYNPLTDPPTIKVDEERIRLWLQRGAQPTEAVTKLLQKRGLSEQGLSDKTEEAELGTEHSSETID
ncbi:MAG: 30S ribosomal protein S16 [Chloroflexi bacterium]|nr:30S ribosomal protein S16 [Chloroflexota bacterium]MCL5076071.1 30S ribosomal protein S16 [Chloroflexota bacterium]